VGKSEGFLETIAFQVDPAAHRTSCWGANHEHPQFLKNNISAQLDLYGTCSAIRPGVRLHNWLSTELPAACSANLHLAAASPGDCAEAAGHAFLGVYHLASSPHLYSLFFETLRFLMALSPSLSLF
jgi:hypothetical protein